MNFKVKNMSSCALMACLLCILAQITIALPTQVPITLQTLGIYLIGLLLKPKYALISTLVYVLMGAIGFPVFAQFSSGIGLLVGPTGGFIFGFPIVSLVISLIGNEKKLGCQILSLVVGTIVCYSIGLAYFMFVTKTSLMVGLLNCVMPFLVGDSLKIVASLYLRQKMHRKINLLN